MALFSRRRLQAMLSELAPSLPQNNALISRLDQKKSPQQSIGAEMELTLLWGISHIADIEIEPDRFSGRARPDAYSANFFAGIPSVIEITTISDEGLLREKAMRRLASLIIQIANNARKGSGRLLRFRFVETNGWANGQYHRHARVTESYTIDPKTEGRIRSWICDEPQGQSMRITDVDLDVVIERTNQIPVVQCAVRSSTNRIRPSKKPCLS